MAAKPGDGAVEEKAYDYDLVVIGGGSGGLQCSKVAAELGAKVAVFDFVKPTNHGTTWGLGGTCVNVGCIPKKLMHYSSLLGAGLHDAHALGWQIGGDEMQKPAFNWERMLSTVTNYIKSLNWGYRLELGQKGVKYLNALASFVDAHTIAYQTNKGEDKRVTAKYIVIAVGGRPHVPGIPGSELAITSDDIFWQKTPPGKTLLIGASYISLETAGFLFEMGFDVTVMVRSILLRGFDRECADMVGEHMRRIGIKFLNHHTPSKLARTDDGRILVTHKNSDDGKESEDVFDTVLFATGRKADTSLLNVEAAGLELAESGKFRCNNERTNVENIFAIGDVVEGRPELTPVAIQAGKLLAQRLFGGSSTRMDYVFVPTAVFTPMEYGCCGYSEDEANDVFGEENLEVYITKSNALEHAATHRLDHTGQDLGNMTYAKLICDKTQKERVVGFHYIGPNAGEVTQGYGLALKLRATKADFDNVVGIHPTTAELFTTLTVTKASGEEAEAAGC